MEDSEELARARLAYISAGRPPLGAPRRADVRADAPFQGAHAPQEAADGVGAVVRGGARLVRSLTLKHVLVVAALLATAVAVTLVALGQSAATEVPIAPVEASTSRQPSASPSASASHDVRVHVAGSVAHPGVVTVPAGSIVQDAIEAAGGLAGDADPATLNLAAPVSDGMQILIGSATAPQGAVVVPSAGTGSAGSAREGGVNLNTATAAELEELPGVGPVTAAAIITWREDNGGFTDIEQLQEVSGIGQKTYERLAAEVTT